MCDFSVFDLLSAPAHGNVQSIFIADSIPALKRVFDHFSNKSFLPFDKDVSSEDSDEVVSFLGNGRAKGRLRSFS